MDYGEHKPQKATASQQKKQLATGGPAGGIASANQGSAGGLSATNTGEQIAGDIKKNRDGIVNLFQILKAHPSTHVLAEVPEPNQLFFTLQGELGGFINLNSIELKFNKNEYISTFNLCQDVRSMCQFHARLFEFDKDKLDKVKSF